MAEFKGIDVSKWQGDIDWAKVKKAGIQFAMIRSSYGSEKGQEDAKLAANVKGCEANDIPYGFYHYSYAKTVDGAKKEAEYFLSVIKNYSPTMPVAFDLEDSSQSGLSKATLTAMVKAFCEVCEKAGYYVILYSNKSWLESKYNMSDLAAYDVWLAQWGSKPTYTGAYGMWQYSAEGSVSGISGDVDMDIAYKDYPSIIKSCGLNGQKKTSVQVAEKPKDESSTASDAELAKAKAQLAESEAKMAKVKSLVNQLAELVK